MKVYNLEEFATKYNLKDIYGAYAAHFYVNGEEGDCFSDFDTYEDDSFCSMFAHAVHQTASCAARQLSSATA